MTRTFNFGKISLGGSRRIYSQTIEVNLKDSEKGPVFTASGTVSYRGYVRMGGQCLDKMKGSSLLFKEIVRLWNAYHLNDGHAGTVEQEKCLNEHVEEHNWDYVKRVEVLKRNNLYVVDYNGSPYEYGTAWIYYPIPEKDLNEIKLILNSDLNQVDLTEKLREFLSVD